MEVPRTRHSVVVQHPQPREGAGREATPGGGSVAPRGGLSLPEGAQPLYGPTANLHGRGGSRREWGEQQ